MVTRTGGKVRGIPASPGIAVGPVYFYESHKLAVSKRHESDSVGEQARLQKALEQAKAELSALCERAKKEAGEDEAAIFEAHSMILEDPELLDRVAGTIDRER